MRNERARGAARAGRQLARGAALAGCLIALAAGGAGAQCEGDCDGNGAVAINELITAVRIALNAAPAATCAAADRDDSGGVTIDELVFAVTRALRGCDAVVDEEMLRASVRATVEPIIRIIDLGSASANGGGAGLTQAQARGAIARPAGLSGCQTFECFAFDEFTGSEEVCCNGDEYSINASTCIFDDEFGNLISRDGFFFLRSDAQDCSGAFPPPGTDFEADFSAFSVHVVDPDLSYVIMFADQSEIFESAGGGCTANQPDGTGIGLRGDGTRFISGVQRQVIGAGDGTVLFDVQSVTDATIDVLSLQDGDVCAVGARINGTLTASDFAAGTEFTADYSDFAVAQVATDDAVLLSLDGSFGTDCVGEVTVRTPEPLRLPAEGECLTGGILEAELSGGSATVAYTPSGGLEIDFGSDGSVDETLASCRDLVLEECTGGAPDLCTPCAGPDTCPEPLGCFACSRDCQSDILRCARNDEFVTCEDGVY